MSCTVTVTENPTTVTVTESAIVVTSPVDSTFFVVDETDATKRLTFSVGGQSTASTLTLTIPALTASRTLNLPLITGTDTLPAIGIAQTWTGQQTFVAPVLGAGTGTSLVLSGSLTSNALTSGWIPVAGASGIITGSANHTYTLDGTTGANVLISNSTAPALGGALIATSGLQQLGKDGVSMSAVTFTWVNAQSNVFPSYNGMIAQGTGALPTATTTADIAVSLRGGGYDGSAWQYGAARLDALVGSLWSGSNRETYWNILTTASGATSTGTRGRFASGGQFIWGGNFGASALFNGGTVTPGMQIIGNNATNGATQSNTLWRNSTTGATYIFAKSRSAVPETPGVITTGDTLGTLSWQGDDGTNLIASAQIVGVSTGTISTGQVPGLLKFSTATSAGTMTQGLMLDATQVAVIGGSSAVSSALYTGGTLTPVLQIVQNLASPTGASLANFRNATTASTLYFGKSRSSTIGTMTVCTTGDTIGTIDFQGADGTNFVSAAKIIATCTGTLGSTQVPGNLVFQTGTNASPSVLTTALTIDNAQMVTFSGDVTHADAKNIILNTSTGTKIGTGTTQKLGFYNVTPIAQRSGAAQAALATTASTQTTPWGFSTQAQADSIITLANELRNWAVAQGFIKGSA